MKSFLQLSRKSKTLNEKQSHTPKLRQNPQKKGICLRILTISPKKPNSANRRVVKVTLTHTKLKLTAKIPGESHNLQQHSTILIRGCRARDLIGVNYSAIRGKLDLFGVPNRKKSRSCYGAKK